MGGMLPSSQSHYSRAFTLIELAIVLVVIGLVVGGVLVGRDLISAAAVRAQVSQIEEYQRAVNAFRGKYGYLPGDIRDPDATNFGFQSRGSYPGEGDGNGVIEGVSSDADGKNNGYLQGGGETGMFWRDLSDAVLIREKFSNAHSTYPPTVAGLNGSYAGNRLRSYMPAAILGGDHYVYVWSGGATSIPLGSGSSSVFPDGVNYFGISHPNVVSITSVSGRAGSFQSQQGMEVQAAYGIDKKMDDGLPQSGSVKAWYVSSNSSVYQEITWATGTTTGSGDTDLDTYSGITPATTNPYWDDDTDLSLLCYYNGHNVQAPEQYNMAYPTKPNCAISIRFQ